MCLCPKQSSLFSFYAMTSGGKLKDAVAHCNRQAQKVNKIIERVKERKKERYIEMMIKREGKINRKMNNNRHTERDYQ